MIQIASNQNFITAAYAITWVVLVSYAVYVVRRGRRAGAEVARLQRTEVRS